MTLEQAKTVLSMSRILSQAEVVALVLVLEPELAVINRSTRYIYKRARVATWWQGIH